MSTEVLDSIIQERRKVLVLFDDMIANIIGNKRHHSIVTKAATRGVL